MVEIRAELENILREADSLPPQTVLEMLESVKRYHQKRVEEIARYEEQLAGQIHSANGGAQGYGFVHLNPNKREVFIEGHEDAPVRLTKREFQFVEYFKQVPEQPITRERIAQDVYAGKKLRNVGGAIDTQIYRLRRILNSTYLGNYLEIETQGRGLGWKLIIKEEPRRK